MNNATRMVVVIGGLAIAGVNTRAGRWLSRDPIQEGDGFVPRDPAPMPEITPRFKLSQPRRFEPNLYAFVCNEPLTRIDPLGLETVQMVATTIIRPPDTESGIKTKHIVAVNEYGRIVNFTHYIGYTDLVLGAPTGGGALTETVSGSHPNFTVTLTGIAWSAILGPSFSIDYTFTFDLNFCMRKGVFNGDHDTYPSYTAQAEGKLLYDYNQKGSPFTQLPGIGGVTAGPVSFNFR